MGKYSMIRGGPTSQLKDKYEYYEFYERRFIHKECGGVFVFKLQKIEVIIHCNKLMLIVSLHTLLNSDISTHPWLLHGLHRHCKHTNNHMIKFMLGYLTDTQCRDKNFNPLFLMKLLENISKIEYISKIAKFRILKNLSVKTNKVIPIENYIIKIGDLSSLTKNTTLENISIFHERYFTKTKIIEQIDFYISVEGNVFVTVTATNKTKLLLINSNEFNFETSEQAPLKLYWKQTIENLNLNPSIIKEFINYLINKGKLDEAMELKKKMLTSFSHHVKNLIKAPDERKETEELPILHCPFIDKKAMINQFNLQKKIDPPIVQKNSTENFIDGGLEKRQGVSII